MTIRTYASVTQHEIITQTRAWSEALTSVTSNADSLEALWRQGRYQCVLFTGCGSTYYLSQAAASLFQMHVGAPACAAPASELLFYPEAHYPKRGKVLLVASSRSGYTSETVAAVQAFRQRQQGEVVVITNDAEKPLAALADVLLAIPAGQEESVAQTRSFASMYVAATAMVATLAQKLDWLDAMRALPQVGDRLLATYDSLARELGGNLDYDRFYFLGSGPRFGLASETNLKMKEMTLTHSEPFPFLEFRHGPMSMAGPSAVIIGMLSASRRQPEAQVLGDMKKLGARVVTLAEQNADVVFDSQLPEAVRNVLYLPVLQLVAYHRAIAKGLNPDRPNNLSAVIELDGLG